MSGLYIFIIALLVFMFAVQSLALGGFLGYGIWWLDVALHFLGGVLLTAVGWWYLYEYKKYPADLLPKRLLILGLLSFAVFGGVLWEFYEFSWDYFFAKPYQAELAQLSLEDTLSDLFFDLAGALVVTIYFLRYHNRGFRKSKKEE